MTQYTGQVNNYTLSIYAPNVGQDYKSVIYLDGSFGLAFLYFVPPDGTRGTNQKRDGENVFDIWYWMYSWPHFVDMLRNEKPVTFNYDDTTQLAEIKTSWEPTGEAEPL